MKEMFSKLRRMDWIMFACMIALIVIGVVFINSAGSARPIEALRSLWRTHANTAAVGLIVYMAFSFLDYRKLIDWAALPIFIVACVLLVAVLLVGTNRFGGRRWLWFFQPSEVAKLAVILFAVHVFAAAGRSGFRWFLAGVAIMGGPALLVLAEPDLGTAIVLVPSVLAILLAARVWTKGIVIMLAAVMLVAGTLLWTIDHAERQTDPDRREQIYKYVPLRSHQIQRLRVFLFPDADRSGAGYNIRQVRISIGSGGKWGKGFKKGKQKLLGYLPPSVSMNDFIFAVLAEEWGFMGVLSMLTLFLGVLAPGLRIAAQCNDDRGRLVVIGILTLVFCHTYVNVAMSVGIVPITGIPLPFISAGRTFLIVLMAALGIVQSVAVHRDGPEPEDGDTAT